MGSARLAGTTTAPSREGDARPGHLDVRILCGYGDIQDVTKATFLARPPENSPYDAHKQKENGKAQLGGPAT
jgi:hypothetical protein